jgi:hypothetical protein
MRREPRNHPNESKKSAILTFPTALLFLYSRLTRGWEKWLRLSGQNVLFLKWRPAVVCSLHERLQSNRSVDILPADPVGRATPFR